METRPFSLTSGSESRHLRIETLTRLRWLAIFGQLAAVLFVAYGLQFSLPVVICLAIIATSAILNVVVELFVPKNLRLEEQPATALLAFDVIQLSALLYFAGGIDNPFAILLLAPVTIAAVSLRSNQIFIIAALVVLSASILTAYHWPLPWRDRELLELAPLYRLALWSALLVATVFICLYAARVAGEKRDLQLALSAAELVLERQNHLSRLDGLAAAAAHELGTPLATIALVSRELSKAKLPDEFSEDIGLLNQEAQRCRTILGRLSSLANERQPPLEQVRLRHFLENVAAPFRQYPVKIEIRLNGDGEEPIVGNDPALSYGLGNFFENAVDFAKNRVILSAKWTTEEVEIDIQDDGPGFPNEILHQIGEPYLRARALRRLKAEPGAGLGLGIFISKTLLERTGAAINFGNLAEGGARIRMRWSRRRIDAART
ncbi:ActS/PrrB/RegB family redox-sensitive histidine kinase [Rhodoblastus sp.]|uniref:ActS/PrrB/RegB family redox-sensitive histidine kinase n=1 Tax=Rhodoblastus sp. TaxID=1962975 RepID=UPI0035B27230